MSDKGLGRLILTHGFLRVHSGLPSDILLSILPSNDCLESLSPSFVLLQISALDTSVQTPPFPQTFLNQRARDLFSKWPK